MTNNNLILTGLILLTPTVSCSFLPIVQEKYDCLRIERTFMAARKNFFEKPLCYSFIVMCNVDLDGFNTN